MDFQYFLAETVRIAEIAIRDIHLDVKYVDAIMNRFTIRNRFWPSELLYNLCSDFLNKIPPEYSKAAAAIELFHFYTLIQDDVLDEHRSRWNCQSLYDCYGANKTILLGDYMATTAIQLLTDISDPTVGAAAPLIAIKHWKNIMLGQILDLENSVKDNMTIQEYINMASLKASIGAMAINIGILLASVAKRECDLLLDFAKWVGISSQIANDFSELYGIRGFIVPYQQDKKRGSELSQGRKTIFHVLANSKDYPNSTSQECVSSDSSNLYPHLINSAVLSMSQQLYLDAVTHARTALQILAHPTPLLTAYLSKANPIHLTVREQQ